MKHLERELERLQKRIVGDEAIDQGENEVTEECLKLLALHQPVAGDLRRIATTLMITTDLERMGDLARHIAEAAVTLAGPRYPIPAKLLRMTDIATTLVRQSLDAFVKLD